MSTSRKNPFQRWFQDYKLRANLARRRRKAVRRAAGLEQMQFVAADAESLEDRVVLDATLNFREFKLIALGANAKFETRTITARPENFSSLGNVNDGRFPLQSQGTSIVTTSKVEVWHVAGNQRLFILPEGGEFREFDWNPNYLANFSGQTTGPDGKT